MKQKSQKATRRRQCHFDDSTVTVNCVRSRTTAERRRKKTSEIKTTKHFTTILNIIVEYNLDVVLYMNGVEHTLERRKICRYKGIQMCSYYNIFKMYKIDWTVTETGRAHPHAHRRVLCVCTAESNFNLIEAHISAPKQTGE